MGKVFDVIDDDLRAFIDEQRLFFVATAPSSVAGHVNVSPKGIDGTFTVLDERTVAYLDLIGSGVETIAHVRENHRICVMFCAFEGRPRIVRLHGTGDVVEPGHSEFAQLYSKFRDYPGVRAIIRVRATRISDSCGYGVPLFDYKGDRDQLERWAKSKGPEALATYQRERNATSLDSLPSMLGADKDES